MGVDWAQLPPELVESISKSLTIYADYLRFRGVCRSWRSSVPKTPDHLPPQLPWLMLPKSYHHRQQPRRAFFNLSNNKVYSFNLPETSDGKRCCGSSHGWLVILDETPSVLLLNPLTRSKLHLPPLSTFPNVLRFGYSHIGREYALRSSTGERYTRSLRQIRDSFVKKVVLSSSPFKPSGNEFIALAILNQTGDLAFCKNGDRSWTFIDAAESYSEDVVYFDGLFYAVNKYGVVAVCDVRGSSPMVSIIETPRQVGADMQYLVNSGDDLLLVSRHLDLDHGNVEELYRTVGFDVFRMDWSGPRWDKVNSLGDTMLFIGQNSSLSLSASDFPGCVGNCIYFTDDYSELNYETVFGECDSGIFRLWDGTIEGRWNSHCREHWPTPIWVSINPS